MKRTAWIALAGAAVLASLIYWLWFRGTPQVKALEVRELATRGLADYLSRIRPGAKVIIIANPYINNKGMPRSIIETEEAGIRGVKAGLAAGLELADVVFPDLKPEAIDNPRGVPFDPQSPTPLSYLVAPDSFDRLHAQHPDCDVIISLIGLPADLSQVQCWRQTGAPGFALLLPDLNLMGDADTLRKALLSGKLLAFVLNKPGAPATESISTGDWRAEFAKRYLLVTTETFEELVPQYPRLFRLK